MKVENKSAQYLIISSTALAAFVAKLDINIVNISLPTITKYFNTNTNLSSFVVMSYLFAITGTLLIIGKLADIIGLRKILIFGNVLFITGSIACGLSPSIYILIFSRLIQGIGAAMLTASSFAIISKLLPENISGKAFGILATAGGIGVLFGAPCGGFISSFLSWHWIFFINVPVGALAVILALISIPKEVNKMQDIKIEIKKFDKIGALISILSIMVLLLISNLISKFNLTSPVVLLSIIIFCFLLIFFILHEIKHPNPLVDIIFLKKNLKMSLVLLTSFIAIMAISGTSFLLPFYLEFTKGLQANETGLIILIYSVIFVLISPAAGRLSDKINSILLCSIALLLGSVALFFFSSTLSINGLLFTVLFIIMLGVAYGLFNAPNNSTIMKFAPDKNKGMISGLLNISRSLGTLIGIMLFEIAFSKGINTDILSSSTSVLSDSMIQGFTHAFTLGGILVFTAMIFSLIAFNKNNSNNII